MADILEEKKKELGQDNPVPAIEEEQPTPAPVEEEPTDEVEATDATPSVEAVGEESAPVEDEAEPIAPAEEIQEKMIPQSMVDKLIGKTRTETRNKSRDEYANELRQKWGVESDEELDGLFGDGQRFHALNDEYGIAQQTITDLQTENALLKSGVPVEKWEDVKAILAYQHLQVTPETIASMLPSHPEWNGNNGQTIDVQPQAGDAFPQAPKQADSEPSIIKRLGGEPSPAPEEDTEASERRKAFEAMGLNR